MNDTFRFIPLNFNWVALNPEPKGVVYFIGGAFWGTFPNIFYRYLLREVFEAGYTVVAIPFRFTFRHWSVSIGIVKDLITLRGALYDEAIFRNYLTNVSIYKESPTSEKFNYLWIGHSLGCKYISLLEALSDIEESDLDKSLDECVNIQQVQDIRKSLGSLDLKDISLKNQPSLFLAPVIAGLQNAIPFPPLAALLKTFGIDVQPNVEETQCLIAKSPLFRLVDIISFGNDKRAKATVDWFIQNLSKKFLKPVKPLPDRNHLAPLGWQNGDELIAQNVIQSISELREKLEQVTQKRSEDYAQMSLK